jgi:Methyltransferase domain
MLDELMERARRGGLTNLAATQGDARSLPYPDSSFDGAYLVTVVHEIPDQDTALESYGASSNLAARSWSASSHPSSHTAPSELELRQQLSRTSGRSVWTVGLPALGDFAQFAAE